MDNIKITPESIANEISSYSESMQKGFKVLTELDAVDVGCSDKEVVYREDKLILYRYSPLQRQRVKTPVLIVYALVNRYYMMDLQEDRSMIRSLLQQGIDVYLIDWGYPDFADRFLNLDDYINGYIHNCVTEILRREKSKQLNILGVCQGGTFSLCYSALHPERVKNLITMVTPVDFHAGKNMLSHIARQVDAALAVDVYGNIPGEILNSTFASLMPIRLSGQKTLDLPRMLEDKERALNYLRMEKWINDSPDQAGAAYLEFMVEFFQRNNLIKNAIVIGDRKVLLGELNMPILNIYATEDHLVPPASSTALEQYVGSDDYQELPFRSGHIGIYVSARAQKTIPSSISRWLIERD